MQTGYFLDHIWLISLFPLVGAGLMLLIGRRLPNSAVSMICVGSVFLSFLFSLGVVWQLSHLPGEYPHFEKVLFDWVPAGVTHTSSGLLTNFLAEWGLLLDPLSAVMILVVTGVGLLIHFYSIGYMAQEGGYYRFFGYMNLFMFFMLTLVLANNMLLMFVGWEGVGLSSYLLIGFYFLRESAADAGKKAFLVNRVGDAGFLLGIFLTVGTLGTIKFTEFGPAIAAGHFVVGAPVLTAIALLLFVGATGKSAQIPLYVWLPDAMEGPTPVSALIHAATMVTAGVYMVTRHNAIYQMAPMAREVVAVIGALTAIYAASIGLVQNDIKRVLAYSTISQLGYMFLACGVGAFAAGMFHLMTHAFFKALLFLGAGSVIHALSGEQDMRRMGGLAEKIRKTWLTMLAATLAIAGIPPLAGFFSKDEILAKTFAYSHLLWVIGWVTAGMTAFYMFRLFFMTFHGPSHVPHEAEQHIHESPGTMTGPLMVLAVLSVVGGWIGIGGRFERFLEPVIARHGLERAEAGAAAHGGSVEYGLMIASVVIALAGIWLARRFYLERPEWPEQLASRWSGLYQLVYRKYYMDEIYDALFVNRVKDLGTTLASFDANVVDGLGVDGAGWLTRTASRLSIWWDTWIVDGLVNLGARIVWLLSYPVRMVQTGLVPNYALLIVLGVLVFLGYYGYHLEILRVWKR